MKETNATILKLYNQAVINLGSSDKIITKIDDEKLKKSLDYILNKSESAKGVLTVVITSLVYKIENPLQDIRLHQANMENGYSGRSFDTGYITPFLKTQKIPAMAESGWLTRSLEQNRPYDSHYSGSIRPKELKDSFLHLIDNVQNSSKQKELLIYIFEYLILQRNQFNIQLAKPSNLSISSITSLLERHFFSSYSAEGASRLPSLAFYAIYQCLTNELKRFTCKTLLPIESHTSADTRSGRIGDIDVVDEQGHSFEAVEIKHGIPITVQLVKDAYEKFSTTLVKRYYILSTANIKEEEQGQINIEIENIKRVHGCQLIVNGIIKSLNYYFRLLNDTSDFIVRYVKLLETDDAIKFEHKQRWNELINEI